MDKFTDKFKNTSFRTPEGYFDNLEESVMKGVSKKEKQLPFMRVWKIAALSSAVAASILIAVFVFNTDKPSKDTPQYSIESNEPDSLELVDFVETADITDEELVEILSESEVEAIYESETAAYLEDADVTDDELNALEDEFSIFSDDF